MKSITGAKPAAAGAILMLALVLVLQAPASGQTGAASGAFQETACALPDVTPDVQPRLRCGTVSVPRDHDHPDKGTFRLAVVIIHPRVQEANADPVLFLHGGPGARLTIEAARIARAESAILARNRELILLDQRGGGRSEPAVCPDLARRQLDVLARQAGEEQLRTAWRATYDDCRRDLVRDGIDPAWFGTNVTVRDLETVRAALGIARWNVYARSYGTEVAMAYEARFPASLRAVVLDSVYPPDPLPLTRTQTFDTALGLLFDACRADPTCAAAHPDLAAAFNMATAALAAEPLTIDLPPGSEPARIVMGPEVFRTAVDRALYFRSTLAAVPKVIQAARDREVAFLRPLAAHLVAQFGDESRGVQALVECRDRPSFHAGSSARGWGISDFSGVCGEWTASSASPTIAEATTVPTLLLTGAIDPITPPAFARMAAARMGPHAQVIEFPQVGHDVEESTPCGAEIVTRFILNPAAAVDAGCVAAVPPVRFQ